MTACSILVNLNETPDKAVLFTALNNARSLHDQAMEQVNRTRDVGAEVEDIRDKLRDLNNNSRHARDNAHAANDLNDRNKLLKDRLLAMIGMPGLAV